MKTAAPQRSAMLPPLLVAATMACGPSVELTTNEGGAGASDSGGAPGATTQTSSGPPAEPDSTGPSVAECGNGIVEPPEQCDDGNRDNFDGCDWDCVDPGPIQFALGWSNCATNGEEAYCWGHDAAGTTGYGRSEACCYAWEPGCEPTTCLVGDDETPGSLGPLPLPPIRSLASGGRVTCAAHLDGTVRCWGRGDPGLGNPVAYAACEGFDAALLDPCSEAPDCCIGDDESAAEAPVMTFPSEVVQVVGGDTHVCVLRRDGVVQCWGQQERELAPGSLGNGQPIDLTIGDDEWATAAPAVSLGGEAVQLTASRSHTCALLRDGTIRCWGHCHGYAPAGSIDTTCLGYGDGEIVGDDETPAQKGAVPLDLPVVYIGTGPSQTCAVMEGGGVRCWGSARWGELGYGDDVDRSVPDDADVEIGAPVSRVAMGLVHSCALTLDGAVYCWGSASLLGLGRRLSPQEDVGDNETPASVGPLSLGGPVRSLHGFDSFQTCAALTDGTTRCWGDNGSGELGLGHTMTVGDDEFPVDVPAIDIFE